MVPEEDIAWMLEPEKDMTSFVLNNCLTALMPAESTTQLFTRLKVPELKIKNPLRNRIDGCK